VECFNRFLNSFLLVFNNNRKTDHVFWKAQWCAHISGTQLQ
jgi:hypothetical protein